MKRVFCSVVTRDYLPFARTLAQTLREHHPDCDIYILLADSMDGEEISEKDFHVVRLRDLNDSETIRQMCFYYEPFELCCALRPWLHEYMFKKNPAETWLFLDADIMVYAPLDEAFEKLKIGDILLNPHRTSPAQSAHAGKTEINLLKMGIYNGGILGIRRTEISLHFITWFKDRLRCFAFRNFSKGQFVDQLWLNLAPLYFPVILWTHPGANLGHWEVERKLTKDSGGKVRVNDQPLLFAHFSKWDFEHLIPPVKVTQHAAPQTLLIWREMAGQYFEKLKLNGYENQIQKNACVLKQFKNGKLITQEMRRLYFEDLKEGRMQTVSPFDNYDYFKSRMGYLKPFFRKYKNVFLKVLQSVIP